MLDERIFPHFSHESPEVRIGAVKQLGAIAKAVGVDRTVEELIPFVLGLFATGPLT